jgi:hypothetical protein
VLPWRGEKKPNVRKVVYMDTLYVQIIVFNDGHTYIDIGDS